MYAGDEINYTGAFLFLDIPLPICYPFLQIKKIVQYFKRNDEESSLPEILQRIPGGGTAHRRGEPVYQPAGH